MSQGLKPHHHKQLRVRYQITLRRRERRNGAKRHLDVHMKCQQYVKTISYIIIIKIASFSFIPILCKKKKDLPVLCLPGRALLSHLRTIVAAAALNFCVRDGYRCARRAISARSSEGFPQSRTHYSLSSLLWPGPRPISAGPLSMSPCLHSRSINLVVFEGP